MKHYACCWSAALLLVTLGGAKAQPINFDSVADGTDISTYYPGMSFSCQGAKCPGTAIYARAVTGTPSVPNGISPLKTGLPGVANNLTGVIRVRFSESVRSVSVDAIGIPLLATLDKPQVAILVAQDSGGNLIGEATGTAFNRYETLTVSAPSNAIHYVVLGVSGNGTATVANFDNLNFVRPRERWRVEDRATMLWVVFGILVLGFTVAAGRYFQRSRRP